MQPDPVQEGGAPSGPAVGPIPIDAPVGKTAPALGANPRSSKSGEEADIDRAWLSREQEVEIRRVGFGGGFAPVTTSGIATSKMACLCAEVGDGPKTTAQFKPMAAAETVCGVPDPKKSPIALLAEQSVVGAMNCSVVGTARSVPLLFNTVNGNENFATVWPREKFEFVRARLS